MNGPATADLLRYGQFIARCPHREQDIVWTGSQRGAVRACSRCGSVLFWRPD